MLLRRIVSLNPDTDLNSYLWSGVREREIGPAFWVEGIVFSLSIGAILGNCGRWQLAIFSSCIQLCCDVAVSSG